MARAESGSKSGLESDQEDIPSQLSAAGISGLVDSPQASIRDVLARAGLRSIKGKFKTREALRAWARAQKEKSGTIEGEIAKERREQAKADRERAQIETAKAKDEVRLAEDVDGLWMDWFAQAASALESAEYLPKEGRIKLSAEIASIRVNNSRRKPK